MVEDEIRAHGLMSTAVQDKEIKHAVIISFKKFFVASAHVMIFTNFGGALGFFESASPDDLGNGFDGLFDETRASLRPVIPELSAGFEMCLDEFQILLAALPEGLFGA